MSPYSEVKLVPVKDQCFDIYMNNNISKCSNAKTHEHVS